MRVRYHDHMLAQDLERFESGIRRDVGGALSHYRPEVVTLVGKSGGTHALHQVLVGEFHLPDDARLIWQTLVWGALTADGPGKRRVPLAALYVVGLADHKFHDPDRECRRICLACDIDQR